MPLKGLAHKLQRDAIEQAAREVIAKNPDNVAKFKSGNEGVFKFFVGQVMKATKGQANPQVINDMLRKLLILIPQRGPMLKIGDKAPDFTLTSDEGKEVSLKDFKGKRVLLYLLSQGQHSG